MIINCDIGERGSQHPTDLELMNHIGMANIACGGHAGDEESIAVFSRIAQEKGLQIAAHLAYPDRLNFGRVSMTIAVKELLADLDRQLALSVEQSRVKLHGALYNDCNVNGLLAREIAVWLHSSNIREVVTPFDSALADACQELGLAVCAEAFAERRYNWLPERGQLVLASRNKHYASIHEVDEALEHSRKIIVEQCIDAVVEHEDGTQSTSSRPMLAKTLCIHSDSEIALPLASGLALLLRQHQGCMP
jgi:UPF0271 protein